MKRVFISITIMHFTVYWFIGIFLLFVFFSDIFTSSIYNIAGLDFRSMESLQAIMRVDISQIYAESSPEPFLNLPSAMIYVFLWSIVRDFFPSFSMLQFLTIFDLNLFIWNVINCILIGKIVNLKRVQDFLGNSIFRNPYVVMSIYMAVGFHYWAYFIGSHDIEVAFFVLLGLHEYMRGKERFAFFYWGIGIIFKITVGFFVLFFLIPGTLKNALKNIGSTLIPHISTALIFLRWPSLIGDFLSSNTAMVTGGFTFGWGQPGNIPVYLFSWFQVPILYTIVILACIFLPLNLFITIEFKDKLHPIEKSVMIILLVFNCVTPFWSTHVIIFLGPFLIWFGKTNTDLSKCKMNLIKFLIFIPLFFSILWLIYPAIPFHIIGALVYLDIMFLARKR